MGQGGHPVRSVAGGDASANGGIDGRLAAFIRTLVDAVDGDTVAQAAALGLLGDDQVSHVIVYRHDPGSAELLVSSAWVRDPPGRVLHDRISLDTHLPPTAAWSTGGTVIVALADLVRDHPLGSAWLGPVGATGAVVVEPMRWRGVVSGVVVVVVEGSSLLTWAFCRRVGALADALALWSAAQHPADVDRSLTSGHAHARALRITERQRAVLDLVRAGRTNAQIARQLGFALGTIKADLTALYRLFGAAGRADLLRRVDEVHLVSGAGTDEGRPSEV